MSRRKQSAVSKMAGKSGFSAWKLATYGTAFDAEAAEFLNCCREVEYLDRIPGREVCESERRRLSDRIIGSINRCIREDDGRLFRAVANMMQADQPDRIRQHLAFVKMSYKPETVTAKEIRDRLNLVGDFRLDVICRMAREMGVRLKPGEKGRPKGAKNKHQN